MSAEVAERSRSPVRRSIAVEAFVSNARTALSFLCDEAKIPESHGLGHALRVLGHAEKGLGRAVGAAVLPEPRALAVRLAALLHDADDKKYFGQQAKGTYPNASKIMQESGVEEDVAALVIRMIDLVSCSKNGNSCPEDARASPELLWPRWADRLEATGEIGVVRCYQYNQEKAVACAECGADPKPTCHSCAGTGLRGLDPLCCADTPRPESVAELWELATAERFQRYQDTKGCSKSMMDHYYDKLLRVACPPFEIVRNSYFEEEMRKGAQPLVNICMAFSKTGLVPIAEIESMEAIFKKAGA